MVFFKLFLIFILLVDSAIGSFIQKKTSSSQQSIKISLDCDVRPFNDLHLLNYFLKQQFKQNPIPDDDLSKKFYEFRSRINLNKLEDDCDKKSNSKFALIKQAGKSNYKFDNSSSNKKIQENRKKISQRMSLELVNALLLGKLLGINLGMLSSVIFSSAFGKVNRGSTTPAPGGGKLNIIFFNSLANYSC